MRAVRRNMKTNIDYVLDEKVKYFMTVVERKGKCRIFLKSLNNRMLRPIKYLKCIIYYN